MKRDMNIKVSRVFRLKDGTKFELDIPLWSKALKMKVESEGLNIDNNWQLIHDNFVEQVNKHWETKTVPTKFSWDESWEADCEDEIFWKLYMDDHSVQQQYEERYGKGSYPRVIVPPQLLKEEQERLPNIVIIANNTKQAKYLDKLHDENFDKLRKKSREMADREFKPFKTQAELAPKVMYQLIRVALMGIMFSEMTEGKGKVVGIGKDKQTVYTSKGFVSVKDENSNKS